MKKVSVVLAVFNGEKYLRDQISSIMCQTYQPLEIVFVDDGSSDNSIQIIESFAAVSKVDIKVVKVGANRGFVSAFELGVSVAQGDIVFFSDQDDIWAKEKLERFIEVFNSQSSIAYVFCNAELMDEYGFYLGETLFQRLGVPSAYLTGFNTSSQVELILKFPKYIFGNCLAVKRASVSQTLPIRKGPENIFSHDTWISSYLSLAGHSGFLLNQCLTKYRIHDGQKFGFRRSLGTNIKVGFARRLASDWSDFYTALLDELTKNGNEIKDRKVLEQKIKHLMHRRDIHQFEAPERLLNCCLELFSLRYFKFSSGIPSFLRDCFRF